MGCDILDAAGRPIKERSVVRTVRYDIDRVIYFTRVVVQKLYDEDHMMVYGSDGPRGAHMVSPKQSFVLPQAGQTMGEAGVVYEYYRPDKFTNTHYTLARFVRLVYSAYMHNNVPGHRQLLEGCWSKDGWFCENPKRIFNGLEEVEQYLKNQPRARLTAPFQVGDRVRSIVPLSVKSYPRELTDFEFFTGTVVQAAEGTIYREYGDVKCEWDNKIDRHRHCSSLKLELLP